MASGGAGSSEATELAARWRRLVGRSPAADVAGAHLLACWQQPHRAYHTIAHLVAVLDRLDELAGDGVEVDQAVRLAAWLHDAVYDPTRADNEERSAELAAGVLGPMGVPPPTLAEIMRLVRLTAGHHPDASDLRGAALCDADLAVLAAAPDTYRAYASAVRREYSHLADPDFRRGRMAVLNELLNRPQLYATTAGRRRWEAPARANLAAELAGLSELAELAGAAPLRGDGPASGPDLAQA